MSYAEYFRALTGFEPYPYQERVGNAGDLPSLVRVPTGLGKTEAVIVAWLWRRFGHPDPAVRKETPRRLVYCLPMRALVEQTAERARQMVAAMPSKVRPSGPYILMGGEQAEEWRRPEDEGILIGTQDMLLSRALNRGYAMSRFTWPIDYGLLNNDVLWVLDEVQLMGSGLPTTVQLQAFREEWGTFGPARTVWMSATCEPIWLETVDRPAPPPAQVIGLDASTDLRLGRVQNLWQAAKRVFRGNCILDSLAEGRVQNYLEAVAGEVLRRHRASMESAEEAGKAPLTLVIVNTVMRAQGIYRRLGERVHRMDEDTRPELFLVHSRFRPPERRAKIQRLLAPPMARGGRIVVSTQVIEAGVDISADVLVTELAPWTALVQRFGRLNRRGENAEAVAVWLPLDLEAGDANRLALPYDVAALRNAEGALGGLVNASPEQLTRAGCRDGPGLHHVLRRRDALDLFDTTPDLAGNDLDVSRFVRDTRDRDVQVFWRSWPGCDKGQPPPEGFAAPAREELCPVGISDIRESLRRRFRPWIWDHLESRWTRLSREGEGLRPGLILLLPAEAGGYLPEEGWAPDSRAPVPVAYHKAFEPDATGSDRDSHAGSWVPLVDHLDDVVEEARKLCNTLGLPKRYADVLLAAARLHDWGKSHPVFQTTMGRLAESHPPAAGLGSTHWAKSASKDQIKHDRPHFRHELASALAALQHGPHLIKHFGLSQEDLPLLLYLLASHHGKVRLSIRAMPQEVRPWEADSVRYPPGTRFARGVWEGDELPATRLQREPVLEMPPTAIRLEAMEIGGAGRGESWLDWMLALRDPRNLGPFRLAWMEMLLRIADWRGSARR